MNGDVTNLRDRALPDSTLSVVVHDISDPIGEAPRLDHGLGLWAVTSPLSRALLAGGRAVKLRFHRQSTCVGEALAVIEQGRIGRKLTITGAAELRFDRAAVDLVDQWARAQAITELVFESVARTSGNDAIEPMSRETSRYADQRLYVLDLRPEDYAARLSKNTARNVKKAEHAGARLISHDSTRAQAAHQRLIGASLSRRQLRGESVAMRGAEHRVEQLVSSGSGVLWQAGIDDEVLSSMFVYVLGPYAYYYDGGTAPEGMQLGISHFLMARIAQTLRSGGVQALNMGIAATGNDGLIRYKEGFGAELWWVERVVADRGTPWRKVRAMLAAGRSSLGF